MEARIDVSYLPTSSLPPPQPVGLHGTAACCGDNDGSLFHAFLLLTPPPTHTPAGLHGSPSPPSHSTPPDLQVFMALLRGFHPDPKRSLRVREGLDIVMNVLVTTAETNAAAAAAATAAAAVPSSDTSAPLPEGAVVASSDVVPGGGGGGGGESGGGGAGGVTQQQQGVTHQQMPAWLRPIKSVMFDDSSSSHQAWRRGEGGRLWRLVTAVRWRSGCMLL